MRALYDSEGFAVEGTLREAVPLEVGYDSLPGDSRDVYTVYTSK